MATGRPRIFVLWLALVPLGCANPGPLSSRQTKVGSLKASVSQLEFENEKLKKEQGELKAENTRLDNQLAQEREANGEVTARLDDAKDLLRRQGGTSQAMGGSSTNFEDDIPPPVATPKSRKVNNGRTSPTVRIPAPGFPSSGVNDDDLGYLPPPKKSRDLGPDDGETSGQWLPVARGLSSSVRK